MSGSGGGIMVQGFGFGAGLDVWFRGWNNGAGVWVWCRVGCLVQGME